MLQVGEAGLNGSYVVHALKGVRAVGLSQHAAAALAADGTPYTWGASGAGQLGPPKLRNSSSTGRNEKVGTSAPGIGLLAEQ